MVNRAVWKWHKIKLCFNRSTFNSMQKFSSNSFIIPGRNVLTSDSVISILFCFLKTMLVVGYLGSDFSRHSMLLGVRKMSRRII